MAVIFYQRQMLPVSTLTPSHTRTQTSKIQKHSFGCQSEMSFFPPLSSEVCRCQVCEIKMRENRSQVLYEWRLWPFCLTWGCRGHVRLSCGWPLVDRSSGASSRRQRRIYYRLTWSYPRCCCSPKAPWISSFCRQSVGSENAVSTAEKESL